ncbi:c-type cytochrome [Myroides injenensis]|uniref:c-type cytochrome n=1 Tax=Myroides injenensis TaxID=1183151 RepID=UPI00028823D9|nr:cytochrome c [Myroides injenensis]
MKVFTIKIWTLLLLTLSLTNTVKADEVEKGKTLFNTYCAACHAVGKKVVGPDLQNVEDRHDIKWIISFVRHSQQMIKDGDEAAKKVFDEYNQVVMPDHPHFTDADVSNIVAYINDQTQLLANKPAGPIVPDIFQHYQGNIAAWHQIIYLNIPGEHKPIEASDKFFWTSLAIAILAMLAFLITLVRIKAISNSGKDIEEVQ